jgi:hypothetical protein
MMTVTYIPVQIYAQGQLAFRDPMGSPRPECSNSHSFYCSNQCHCALVFTLSLCLVIVEAREFPQFISKLDKQEIK